MKHVGAQDGSPAALLCEIKLEGLNACLANMGCHTAGATERVDYERAGDQVEVSQLSPGVSTLLLCCFGTDCDRKQSVPVPNRPVLWERKVGCRAGTRL